MMIQYKNSNFNFLLIPIFEMDLDLNSSEIITDNYVIGFSKHILRSCIFNWFLTKHKLKG